MNVDNVAKRLKELGHTTRLNLYKRITKTGLKGIPVGKLQEQFSIPGSTLSHHIASLVSAHLIVQRREGRLLYCVAQFDELDAIIQFLLKECCADDLSASKTWQD